MKRRAYLVGKNGPAGDQLGTLHYAESDAVKMANALRDESAGFDDVKVASLEEDSFSCLSAFEKISAACGRDDVLLFYFSGHGHSPRGELFLLFPETDLNRLVTTALPISSVKAIMAGSKARVRLLILDCCHSGAAGRDTWKSLQRPEALPLVEAARDSASIIIAACGKYVITREQEEFGGGFLTHLLCRALGRDDRDADIDGDGLLSVTDFIHWAGLQTGKHNKCHDADEQKQLETPEVYGDFRSQIYLTANRFEVHDDELAQDILQGVANVRSSFKMHRGLALSQLQALARPIKALAPTLTKLDVLDALFEKEDDAAIFAAATILQVRRDPQYMGRLIKYVNEGRLRGSANWRVLRAIRDTVSRYKFSNVGRKDLVQRLREAAQQRKRKLRPRFTKSSSLTMIRQIVGRLDIPFEEVFDRSQILELNQKSRKRFTRQNPVHPRIRRGHT